MVCGNEFDCNEFERCICGVGLGTGSGCCVIFVHCVGSCLFEICCLLDIVEGVCGNVEDDDDLEDFGFTTGLDVLKLSFG